MRLVSLFCLAWMTSVPAGLPADEPRTPFRETLERLELSPEQRARVARLLVDYRGRYETEEFRTELLAQLTADQVDRLETLQAGRRPAVKIDDLQIDRDIAYDAKAGVDAKRLSLDVYRKRADESPRPVMVMIHGGGWRIGDKGHRSVGVDKARLFVDHEFVYVSINYRLSPAVTHPAHVEDVAAAIAWVHDQIAVYNGNPDRIFVMGHSAGAHLAALVSTDERRLKAHGKDLSAIKGTILLDGAGYDVAAQMKLNRLATSSMYRDAFTDDESTQRDASPIRHVAAGKSIPPFLIIPIASRPDSCLQSQRLAKAINDVQGKARVYIAADKTHSSLNTEIGTEADNPSAEIIKFIKENLSKSP